MRYQLILQLPFASLDDYDALIRLEERVRAGLGEFGTVDGHDAGSGEMNIFVLTHRPALAFAQIAAHLGSSALPPDLKAAYREVGSNAFTVVYPSGLTAFGIA